MSRTIQRQFFVGAAGAGNSEVYPTYVTVNHYLERGKWRLSITGVEGPMSNGDCRGGCGQIIDTLRRLLESRSARLAIEKADLARLIEVWDEWHLNDTRAGCNHQRAKGADLHKELTIYTWKLSTQAYSRQRELEQEIVKAKVDEQELQISDEDRTLLKLPITGMGTLTEEAPTQWHVLDKVEKNAANWVRFTPSTEPQPWSTAGYGHPEGMLCKPCEECGYRYGTAWLYEPVPEDVLDFLETLPHNPPVGRGWVENFKR